MNHPKRILICPLNWGLGHATRCIPIIRLLLQKKQVVIIAAEGEPLKLLKIEFPELEFIEFIGVKIEYSNYGFMFLKMLLTIPKIIKGIKKEHNVLDKLIAKHKIDIVISDNRYGCWSIKTKSIFITHQLMVKSPIAENIIHKILSKFINKFDECWVPDYAGDYNLSGDLSHKYPLSNKIKFIGFLSRFSPNNSSSNNIKYEIAAIISGPEPQRSIFEKIVTNELIKHNKNSVIVLGLPSQLHENRKIKNLTIISHLDAKQMQSIVENSNIIISRSGYSTIMDLAVLNKKAIFIPTPGQTEQEYLAERLMKMKISIYQNQSNFNLEEALKESNIYSAGFEKLKLDNSLLEKRINTILSLK